VKAQSGFSIYRFAANARKPWRSWPDHASGEGAYTLISPAARAIAAMAALAAGDEVLPRKRTMPVVDGGDSQPHDKPDERAGFRLLPYRRVRRTQNGIRGERDRLEHAIVVALERNGGLLALRQAQQGGQFHLW
jgi:hypothetical protein